MTERSASRTALATAYMRAAHQLLDPPPRTLEDPLALRLLGQASKDQIAATQERFQTPENRALRAHVAQRSRFAEDRLAAAVTRGVTQYVILGAGFDTFALRQPAWASRLRIVEVDHAGTQELKRSLLAAAGLSMPPNATFATVDFEHESLRDGLLRHGSSAHEPTFFSWLGVTMYLAESAVDAVLQSIAQFLSGSEIVLTFASRSSLSPMAERAAQLGEPWLSFFEPEQMAAKLRGHGFALVELFAPLAAAIR